jgi:four helix bundle protein
MFDFENLLVYQKAKVVNRQVYAFLEENPSLSRSVRDQLSRASLSIMLNIAEGSGRATRPDKRNFFVIARGSAFECVAVLDFLKESGKLDEPVFQAFYQAFDELSRMLFSMIRKLG